MEKDSKIYVAGHTGMVGSAIVSVLKQSGYNKIITRTHSELSLENQKSVVDFFEHEKPDYVFLAAAKVGGIIANTSYPGAFIRDNLMIQTNVIDAAYRSGVKKLLFLGSSCIYPKMTKQPIQETSLLTGALEPTNQPYAIAKIAGIEMCNAYKAQYGFDTLTVMPSNVYGINDNFHPQNSHLIAGMMQRFHQAKIAGSPSAIVWGDGSPLREFIFSEDLGNACVYLMQKSEAEGLVNVGSGIEISVKDLATLIKDVVNFKGKIEFDTSKPNGTPRKLMDISTAQKLGWETQTTLHSGLTKMYGWYLKTQV